LTAIPAAASPQQVIAFDTGPGNMVIDALTERLFGTPYDRDGHIAASGTVLEDVISTTLRASYFRRRPPKTAGREEFGQDFVPHFLACCGRARKQDAVAPATALTAYSIADALERFVVKRTGSYRDFVVSGGGVKNSTLLAMLVNRLLPLGLELRLSDELGLPA